MVFELYVCFIGKIIFWRILRVGYWVDEWLKVFWYFGLVCYLGVYEKLEIIYEVFWEVCRRKWVGVWIGREIKMGRFDCKSIWFYYLYICWLCWNEC